jgi:hypothetical protein
MGAHGTCEEALRNVAAFHTASVEDDRNKSRSGKKSKDKDKKKKKKNSKSDKHGKQKKDVKQQRSKKQKSSSGDESSSEGGSDVETREQELERGRAAVRVTRDIMSRYPEVKQDLREVGTNPVDEIAVPLVFNVGNDLSVCDCGIVFLWVAERVAHALSSSVTHLTSWKIPVELRYTYNIMEDSLDFQLGPCRHGFRICLTVLGRASQQCGQLSMTSVDEFKTLTLLLGFW